MSANSGIEWTEATWNPLAGCRRVSPGCQHCYAETMAKRLASMGQAKYQGLLDGHGRWNGRINLDEKALLEPIRRRKGTTYFVNSMSDLFHEDVPDEFITKVFAVMCVCSQHRFIVLTKRAERMCDYMVHLHAGQMMFFEAMRNVTGTAVYSLVHASTGRIPAFENVVLGVSAENQRYADERVPYLLETPAACRLVSAEPLLGPIDFTLDGLWETECPRCAEGCAHDPETNEPICVPCMGTGKSGISGIDWVITGGESGPGARPCELDWVRGIVGQCREAGVSCFVKQMGSNSDVGLKNRKGSDMGEWPEDVRVREMPGMLAR